MAETPANLRSASQEFQGGTVQPMLKSMADRLAESAHVKRVYGDPVTVGERTVIPVARVRYGFGGGAGRKSGAGDEGGGGGGGVVAAPVGVVEITPQGTRFIAIPDWRRIAAIAALGVVLGMLFARRRRK